MTVPRVKRIRQHHEIRAGTYLFFFFSFGLIVYAAHLAYLRLPYFWDELGQFVPAALDILRDNAWIPRSTTPNIHPPGVMAYLAGIWRVFGYSIAVTRSAMLMLAAFGVLFTFLLSLRLCEKLPGIPALFAVLLLLCDPLFYTQAMMAQLDMPAMVFGLIALVLFFEERHHVAAMACTAAVLSKETAVLLPLVFTVSLLREKRLRKDGLFYAIPFFALAVWLLALQSVTGTAFGNQGFEHYNVAYALNPVRVAMSLLRRLYYLFIDNFRWVGTVTIFLSWRRHRIYSSRAWRITMIFAAAHIILVSVLGGAELERYLLPVMPIFYVAVAAALSTVPQSLLRNVGMFALCGGLITGMFINPVFPFPYENNLAMADFVQLHQMAAQYLESHFKDKIIYTAWPLTPALRRPEFGYVQHPLKTHETTDLHYSSLAKLDPKAVEVLVLYSRTWEPHWSVMQIAGVDRFLARFYQYEPQMTEEQCRSVLGVVRTARWEQGGQWIAVYAKPQ
jgi:Dolichyl-phosphate-mannose-protein mannosyltransferase